MGIKIDFRGVGGPTERMIDFMIDICEVFPLRQELEEYDDRMWDDFELASKFIGANIERYGIVKREIQEKEFHKRPRSGRSFVPKGTEFAPFWEDDEFDFYQYD